MAKTNQREKKNAKRQQLISKIEAERQSKVITYILADRRHAAAQVAEDAVRPMYDHLQALKVSKKIDLFLYSTGGHIEIPWRIVTMIREFCDEFAVLVPYKAMSAATLIALGADEIVMGRKGELGPIDPQLTIQRGDGGTAAQELLSVEDVMSYVRFIREKVGLKDQAALSGPVASLAEYLGPASLGQINRIHSHIREVAHKLLSARASKKGSDDQRNQVIVDTLAEKTFQHGHAIGRREAEEIGLNILRPAMRLERHMWSLLEEYEELLGLREPIDHRTYVPPEANKRSEHLTLACIESVDLAHQFLAELVGQVDRQQVPQLTLNLSLALQLPPGLDPQTLSQDAQLQIQRAVEEAKKPLQELIAEEVRKQMPVVGYKMWTQNGRWERIADWPSIRPPRSTTSKTRRAPGQSSP